MGRDLAGDPALLGASLAECDRRLGRLAQDETALRDALHTHEWEETCEQEIARHLRASGRSALPAPAAVTRAQEPVAC